MEILEILHPKKRLSGTKNAPARYSRFCAHTEFLRNPEYNPRTKFLVKREIKPAHEISCETLTRYRFFTSLMIYS